MTSLTSPRVWCTMLIPGKTACASRSYSPLATPPQHDDVSRGCKRDQGYSGFLCDTCLSHANRTDVEVYYRSGAHRCALCDETAATVSYGVGILVMLLAIGLFVSVMLSRRRRGQLATGPRDDHDQGELDDLRQSKDLNPAWSSDPDMNGLDGQVDGLPPEFSAMTLCARLRGMIVLFLAHLAWHSFRIVASRAAPRTA